MQTISNEKINEIRSSVDIVEVISSYLALTQKGKNYFGVCPFHDDHAPSMSVSKDKQIYTCFSCGATGNVFNFVMEYEHITFMEAVKILADKAGIEVNINSFNHEIPKKNQNLYEIYELSNKFYQNNINTKNGLSAKTYLSNRGIDEKIVKEFGIGLSLPSGNMLTTLLTKKFDESDVDKSGLIAKNEYGLHDVYSHRIMFPLWDLTGKVVGFSGRIYETDDSSKYVNSKETEIFKKGELLYHYHLAKDECRIKKSVIIMEGFMDVIRASTIGINNVVATMGTAVTSNQAQLIKRLSSNVILCFDGDAAGLKATLACSEELIKIGITPKVVRLEENLDPDEYIRKYGEDQFKRKIDQSLHFMDFKMSYLKTKKDLNSGADLSSYIHDIIDELSKIDDEILREVTINKMSEESNLSVEFLKEQLSKKTVIQVSVKSEKPKVKISKYQKAEQRLLYYMLKSKEVVKIYHKKITYMPTERYRLLARQIEYFVQNYGDIVIADFITFVRSDEVSYKTLSEIASLKLKDNYTLEEIDDYIHVIKECNIGSEQNRLKELMKKEIDPIKKAEIAQKIVDLKVRGEEYD